MCFIASKENVKYKKTCDQSSKVKSQALYFNKNHGNQDCYIWCNLQMCTLDSVHTPQGSNSQKKIPTLSLKSHLVKLTHNL